MAKAEYRNAVRSREMIVDALTNLMQFKPLNKITITDVVNLAQINRGTFYAHFDSVESVVFYISRSILEPVLQTLSLEAGNLVDASEIMMYEIRKIIEMNQPLLQKVCSSGASSYFHDVFVSIIEEYMVKHKEKFFAGDEKRYAALIRFCAGGLSNLYQDWFNHRYDITLDELTNMAIEIVRRVAEE